MRTFNWRPRKQKDRRGGATFCDKPSRRESESESEAVEKNDEEKKEKKRENEWPGLGPARGWRWWSGLVLKRDARGGGLVCVLRLSAEKPVRPPEELSQPGRRYLDIPGGCRLGPPAGRTSPVLAVPASRGCYCASSGEASDPGASTVRRTGLYCRPYNRDLLYLG